MRKLRHRETEQLDQGHTAKKVVELGFKHRSCHCKACALTHYPRLPCYLTVIQQAFINHITHADTALGAEDMARDKRHLILVSWH